MILAILCETGLKRSSVNTLPADGMKAVGSCSGQRKHGERVDAVPECDSGCIINRIAEKDTY